jgi:hypothetical protein
VASTWVEPLRGSTLRVNAQLPRAPSGRGL